VHIYIIQKSLMLILVFGLSLTNSHYSPSQSHCVVKIGGMDSLFTKVQPHNLLSHWFQQCRHHAARHSHSNSPAEEEPTHTTTMFSQFIEHPFHEGASLLTDKEEKRRRETFQKVCDQAYDGALADLQVHPEDATFTRQSDGNTILHILSVTNPRTENEARPIFQLAQLITSVDPGQVITMNRQQKSPLSHVLDTVTPTDWFGLTLAHILLTKLPESPGMLIHPLYDRMLSDGVLRNHFHVACSNKHCPQDLLSLMLWMDPKLANTLCGNVHSAIGERHDYYYSRDVSRLPTHIFTTNPLQCYSESRERPSLHVISLIISAGLTGVSPKDLPPTPTLTLHQACQYMVPFPLFKGILKGHRQEFRDQVMLQDQDGFLPIHYAVSLTFAGCKRLDHARRHSLNITKKLLEVNPDCAFAPDINGKSALEHAITIHHSHPSLIEAIVTASPGAITQHAANGRPLLHLALLAYKRPTQSQQRVTVSMFYSMFNANPNGILP
jgi:hypothetical protein